MANEMISYVNAERQARGLQPLRLDTTFASGAQGVAEKNSRDTTHNRHSNPADQGAPAEVVYWSNNFGSSAAVNWWMGSQTHRGILMSPKATRIGIGVACHGNEYDATGWLDGDMPDTPTGPVTTPANAGTHCDPSSTTHPAPQSAPAPQQTTSTTTAPAATPAPSNSNANGNGNSNGNAPQPNANANSPQPGATPQPVTTAQATQFATPASGGQPAATPTPVGGAGGGASVAGEAPVAPTADGQAVQGTSDSQPTPDVAVHRGGETAARRPVGTGSEAGAAKLLAFALMAGFALLALATTTVRRLRRR